MSETLVVLDSDTAVITTESVATVVTENNTITTIVTGLMGPPGSTEISKMDDIDFSSLQTGSTLVYNDAINKWVATRVLDQQVVDCGEY